MATDQGNGNARLVLSELQGKETRLLERLATCKRVVGTITDEYLQKQAQADIMQLLARLQDVRRQIAATGCRP